MGIVCELWNNFKSLGKEEYFWKTEKPKIKIFLFKHDVTTKPDPQKSIHESNNSISFTTKLPQSLGKLKAGS